MLRSILREPVGIGEHSDVMAKINNLNAIAQAHEKIGNLTLNSWADNMASLDKKLWDYW